MAPARSTASHASVAFLKIPDFAQLAVAEQAHLKERLEQLVTKAMPEVRTDERIVVDAPEGMAVVFLANPAAALKLAWSADDEELAPAIGLAHGPVRMATGTPPVLYGDALLAAEGAARATNPGGVSATRDFRDALSRTHPGLRRLLARTGSAVDDQGRAFEIFRADVRTAARRRQRFFATTGIIAIAIVAAGFAIQALKPPPPPPPAPPPVQVQAPPPEPQPGAITFEVKPEGEIYVDDVLKGKSPPLKKIQVPPGDHTIEVRNGSFKPLVTELTVGPGEEFAVTHNFVVAAPPKAPVKTKSAPRPKPQQQPKAAPGSSKADAGDKGFWQRFVDWFKNGS